MKKLSRILAIVLSLVLCLGLLATTGYAAEAEQDGLKLTLTTDKEEYTEFETVIATLKVENVGNVTLNNVVMNMITPEGLNASGEESKTLESLAAGASGSMMVSYRYPVNPETGDSSSILFVCAIALVCCLAMLALTWNRKSAAMVLALVMVLGMAAMVVPANAAHVAAEVSTSVKINGQKFVLKASAEADAEEPKPEEPVDQVVLNFEDGSVGNPYNSDAWLQEIYKDSGWAVTSNQMNSRNNPDGTSKVVNFASDGSARRFTYTLETPMETVTKISVDMGNYWGSAVAVKYKVALIDAAGDMHYIVGDSSNWQTFPVNTNLVKAELPLTTPVSDVVAIRIVTQSSGTSYLYCDNLTIEGKKAEVVEKPEEPLTNVALDFEDGSVGNPYNSDAWRQEIYKDSGWAVTSNQMNSRNNPAGTSKVVNFASDASARIFTYSFGGTMASVDRIAVEMGNYWGSAVDIKYKVSLIDAAGDVHYIVGDSSSWETFPVTTNLLSLEIPLETPVSDVVAIRIVTQSNATSYLYVDNLVISGAAQEEAAVSTWTKVEAADDWTGTYLVVCDAEDVKKFWNPNMLGNDGNAIDVDIADGKITGDWKEYAITITKVEGTTFYNVQLPNGKYLNITGNAFTGFVLGESDTPVNVTIGKMLQGYLGVGLNYLTWNTSSGKFTAAKGTFKALVIPGLGGSTGTSTTVCPYLYKLEEEPAEPTYVKTETAEDWTGTYLVVCDAEDVMKLWNPAMLGNDGNAIDVDIEGGMIVGDYKAYEIVITKVEGTTFYNVQLPNGKYLNITGNAFTGFVLGESDTPVNVTIGKMLQGYLGVGVNYLTWNTSSGKFTAAKGTFKALVIPGLGGSTGTSTTVCPYLYKLVEE